MRLWILAAFRIFVEGELLVSLSIRETQRDGNFNHQLSQAGWWRRNQPRKLCSKCGRGSRVRIVHVTGRREKTGQANNNSDLICGFTYLWACCYAVLSVWWRLSTLGSVPTKSHPRRPLSSLPPKAEHRLSTRGKWHMLWNRRRPFSPRSLSRVAFRPDGGDGVNDPQTRFAGRLRLGEAPQVVVAVSRRL